MLALLKRVEELDVAAVTANADFANHFVQEQRGGIALMDLLETLVQKWTSSAVGTVAAIMGMLGHRSTLNNYSDVSFRERFGHWWISNGTGRIAGLTIG